MSVSKAPAAEVLFGHDAQNERHRFRLSRSAYAHLYTALSGNTIRIFKRPLAAARPISENRRITKPIRLLEVLRGNAVRKAY